MTMAALAQNAFVYQPDVAFRGSRNYYHSTDLYEHLLRGADEGGLCFEGPIDLRIRKHIVRQPLFRFASSGAIESGAEASCRFTSRGEAWGAWVSQGAGAIVARKPYDETAIWHACRREEQSLVLDADTGSRPIETVTALGVHLHKLLLPPPDGQRWYLAQLKLARPLQDDDARRITITLAQTIGRSATRTAMTAADGPLGDMMFILR